MSWLDRCESKWGRLALPQLTQVLIGGQVLAYLLSKAGLPAAQALAMVPDQFLAGQYWRGITFLMMPPDCNVVFAFFGWYMFFLMGTSLEREWGTFRYNIFILLGWAVTFGISFLTPHLPANSFFLAGSVFLAFAWLFPEFEIFLFFILPVQIRWIALVTWIFYGYTLLFGTPQERFLLLASLANFFVFFGRDIWTRVRTGHRKMKTQAQVVARQDESEPRHRCAFCGRTSESHPELEFRYCRDCRPTSCYCADHVKAHIHRAEAPRRAR